MTQQKQPVRLKYHFDMAKWGALKTMDSQDSVFSCLNGILITPMIVLGTASTLAVGHFTPDYQEPAEYVLNADGDSQNVFSEQRLAPLTDLRHDLKTLDRQIYESKYDGGAVPIDIQDAYEIAALKYTQKYEHSFRDLIQDTSTAEASIQIFAHRYAPETHDYTGLNIAKRDECLAEAKITPQSIENLTQCMVKDTPQQSLAEYKENKSLNSLGSTLILWMIYGFVFLGMDGINAGWKPRRENYPKKPKPRAKTNRRWGKN